MKNVIIERGKLRQFLISDILSITKSEDDVIKTEFFITENILKNPNWSFSLISDVLTMIKWEMVDTGKEAEFEEIFEAFGYKNRQYRNWGISDVIRLLTVLSVRYKDILKAILLKYERSIRKEGGVENE